MSLFPWWGKCGPNSLVAGEVLLGDKDTDGRAQQRGSHPTARGSDLPPRRVPRRPGSAERGAQGQSYPDAAAGLGWGGSTWLVSERAAPPWEPQPGTCHLALLPERPTTRPGRPRCLLHRAGLGKPLEPQGLPCPRPTWGAQGATPRGGGSRPRACSAVDPGPCSQAAQAAPPSLPRRRTAGSRLSEAAVRCAQGLPVAARSPDPSHGLSKMTNYHSICTLGWQV